jgi:hypothetical protein
MQYELIPLVAGLVVSLLAGLALIVDALRRVIRKNG